VITAIRNGDFAARAKDGTAHRDAAAADLFRKVRRE